MNNILLVLVHAEVKTDKIRMVQRRKPNFMEYTPSVFSSGRIVPFSVNETLFTALSDRGN
jgi:hypothetical protein